MLIQPQQFNQFNWSVSSLTNVRPTTTIQGAAVTAGSGSKGSWVQILDDTDVINDVYQIKIKWANVVDTASTSVLFDLGIDTTGGTSFVSVLSDVQMGSTANKYVGTVYNGLNNGPKCLTFPLFIPAGSSIAIRTISYTTITARFALEVFGLPSLPETCKTGTYINTYRDTTYNYAGTIINGTTTQGSWVTVGTTTKDHWYWNVSCAVYSGVANAVTAIDIAVTNATGNEANNIIIPRFLFGQNEQVSYDNFGAQEASTVAYKPSGSIIRARCHSSVTASMLNLLTVHAMGD